MARRSSVGPELEGLNKMASTTTSFRKGQELDPVARARYDADMAQWLQEDKQARITGSPRPRKPEPEDYGRAGNGYDNINVTQVLEMIQAGIRSPANDDAPPAKADEERVEQIAAQKLNGGQTPAQAVQIPKDLTNFLSRVVPWPQPDMPGFVNVHYRRANCKGITGGRAFTELNKMVSFVGWAKRNPEIIWDLYFCTSLQAKCGAECKSGLKAERSTADALLLRAIWADIDKYHGKKDGLEALREFCEVTGTPYPTAIIDSGNGYHVYWVSDRLLSRAEWQPYADGLDALMTQHGLKHDAVTTDAARILRIPGTSNFKQNPPKPVVIKLLEADISFASALGHLLEVKVEARKTKADKQSENLADGITKDHWYATLTPQQKDEIIHHGLSKISANPITTITKTGATKSNIKVLELHEQDGDYELYLPLIFSIARSGAPDAENLFVKFASKAKGADDEDALRAKFQECARDADGRITVGTFLHYAELAGADFSPQARADRGWTAKAADAANPSNTIDWSKVRSDWKIADLPADAPLTVKIMLDHTGGVRDLSEELVEKGLIHSKISSWPNATKVLANSLQRAGYSPEQMAEILSAKLPCNKYIHDHTDVRRIIEKVIERARAKTEAKGNDTRWPDGVHDDTGRPRKGLLNTIEAIMRIGITCTRDEFRRKAFWYGHTDHAHDGELSDEAVAVTRRNIATACRFTPATEDMHQAVIVASADNRSNPVVDYFNNLKWDGVQRLATWLIDYLGADDTPLNRAYAVKFFCAIVRRAKRPGCKFDGRLDLQGEQDIGKSLFCADLAIFPDLYTDVGDLSADSKQMAEIGQGMQIIEFAENVGHNAAKRNENKRAVTRQVERARMAYDRYTTNSARTWVGIATLNPGGYLNDPTGERRYWNVLVRHYAGEWRAAFLAIKDQLYAEAVELEPGMNLFLDTDELKAAHDANTAKAKEPNELVDILSDLKGETWDLGGDKYEERVSTRTIRGAMGFGPADACRMQNYGRRINEAMMQLGWTKAPNTIHCHKQEEDGHPTSGYFRPTQNPNEVVVVVDPVTKAQEALKKAQRELMDAQWRAGKPS
jgi:hypothetical protein